MSFSFIKQQTNYFVTFLLLASIINVNNVTVIYAVLTMIMFIDERVNITIRKAV